MVGFPRAEGRLFVLDAIPKLGPKLLLKSLDLRQFSFAPLRFLLPLTRFLDGIETNCWRRVRDSPHLESDDEQVDTFATVLVQPLDSVTMLVVEHRCDPRDDVRVDARSIGERFAEMVVVGIVELVLDDDLPAICHDLSKDIHVVLSHALLAFEDLKIEAQRVLEVRRFFRLDFAGEPGSEITFFVVPSEI